AGQVGCAGPLCRSAVPVRVRPVRPQPPPAAGAGPARACCAPPMRPDVPRPPREPGAGPPVATPSGRRVRVLLALALAGLAATTAGTAQVPASAGVPASADGPVPADVPAGGDGPTAGSDYDWPVAGDPPEVAHPFDPPPRPWLPGHRG